MERSLLKKARWNIIGKKLLKGYKGNWLYNVQELILELENKPIMTYNVKMSYKRLRVKKNYYDYAIDLK